MDENLLDIGQDVAEKLGKAIIGWEIANDELTVRARRDDIVKVIKFLRDDPACHFNCIVDLCGVDYPDRAERFEVVYHLLSLHQNTRIRVKVSTDADTPVPSIVELFVGANWFEREAFDMYGILFADHPDLRRLLTDYGFEGHPLRKDFPLTGHVEVRYSEDEKRVVYEPVKLTQEFRDFDYLSPWEGGQYILPGDEKAAEMAGEKEVKG